MHTGLTCVCLLVLFTFSVNGVLQEMMGHHGHRHHRHHRLKDRLNRHHIQHPGGISAPTPSNDVTALLLERSEKVASVEHSATNKAATEVVIAKSTKSTKSQVAIKTAAKTAVNAKVHIKLAERLKQKANLHSKTEQLPVVDAACCSNAQDSVARAAGVANVQSISDMKSQVQRLTQALTVAIAPPDVSTDPNVLTQENSAQIENNGASTSGVGAVSTAGIVPSVPVSTSVGVLLTSAGVTGGVMPTGAVPPATSTGSAAECNAHINLDTAKGDKDIWKEVDAANQAQLNTLMGQLAPQIHPGLVTDPKVLQEGEDLLTDDTEKHTEVKKQITDTCAGATCAADGGDGTQVQADTSVVP